MSKIKEETQKILQHSPEYWAFNSSVCLLISFIAIGVVMILDFFMRVWWLDLILYLVAFASFDRAMFYAYSYGQSSLMFFWDKLVVHYEDEKQNIPIYNALIRFHSVLCRNEHATTCAEYSCDRIGYRSEQRSSHRGNGKSSGKRHTRNDDKY